MNVCVYGLSSELLERFFLRECARRAQPLVASSAAELRFGLVAGGASMGAWGRTWPVALERCRCQQEPCVHVPWALGQGTAATAHYVAQVRLTPQEAADLQQWQDAGMPCRLVVLEEAFFRAVPAPESRLCATPGTVIAGVDQRHTAPSRLRVAPAAESAALGAAHAGCGVAAVQWLAVLDVRPSTPTPPPPPCEAAPAVSADPCLDATTLAAAVVFASTGEQFAMLHNLPALPARPAVPVLATPSGGATPIPETVLLSAAKPAALSDGAEAAAAVEESIPPFCECDAADLDKVAIGTPGPLLSLTFYANDPSHPYDQSAWQADLTARQSEVVTRRMRETADGVPSTTVCHVTDVRPIAVEGSSWCPSHLPTPAPLEQQLREVRAKRAPAASAAAVSTGTASPPGSPASSMSTASSFQPGRHHTHRDSTRRSAIRKTPTQPSAGFLSKGWCVRPLQTVKPVLPQTGNVDSTGSTPLVSRRSQHAWTCLLNLRELEEFGIEVTVKVPYVVDGTVLNLQGNTVLFSDMLHASTSGTLLVPVFCPAPADAPPGVTPLWLKLYVQYLLVFPLGERAQPGGPLEHVRSVETYAQLTVPTLIGHRGLGKTYTRSPAVCGAAPLVLKCNENTIASFQAAHARRCAMIEFDVMLSADRVPVVIHDPLIELMALKREGVRTSSGRPEYTTVRAEVHKLNWSQLRDLHAQCCKTLGRVFPIKDLFMHHWESLVWWARNKVPASRLNGSAPLRDELAGSVRSVESALMRAEDFPYGVPSLREVLEQTPPALGFNLEVKYPFQPRSDSNLFLQSDAFEVNGFVDAILRVIADFAGDGRSITFSSFDPNICLALALKQSRYDVFFLSDTLELRDLKDYRSFYVEGAIQFAASQHLAGISMNACTLLSPQDEAALPAIPETALRGTAARGPVTAELFPAHDASLAPPTVSASFGAYGRALVAEMHHRGLKVWTWGSMNNRLYFAYVQAAMMRVDGVIGDRMPVFAAPSDEERAAVAATTA